MTTTTRRGKSFQDLVSEAKGQIHEVNQDEFKQWLEAKKEDLRVIDLREPHDHSVGRIPGALNIPRGMLEVEIEDSVPDQDQLVVLYCGGGSRSAHIAAKRILEDFQGAHIDGLSAAAGEDGAGSERTAPGTVSLRQAVCSLTALVRPR